jgi:hypothetical protein
VLVHQDCDSLGNLVKQHWLALSISLNDVHDKSALGRVEDKREISCDARLFCEL